MFGGYGRVQSSGFDYEKIKFVKSFPKNLQSNILKYLALIKNLIGANTKVKWII